MTTTTTIFPFRPRFFQGDPEFLKTALHGERGFFWEVRSSGHRALGGKSPVGPGRGNSQPTLISLLPGDGSSTLDMGPHSACQFTELRPIFEGQICGFEGVAFEIEELPGLHWGVFDELPRTAAHGPAGLAHVAEIAFASDPEEITLEGGLTSRFEKGEDGAAIDFRG